MRFQKADLSLTNNQEYQVSFVDTGVPQTLSPLVVVPEAKSRKVHVYFRYNDLYFYGFAMKNKNEEGKFHNLCAQSLTNPRESRHLRPFLPASPKKSASERSNFNQSLASTPTK